MKVIKRFRKGGVSYYKLDTGISIILVKGYAELLRVMGKR